jgi:UDP-N-acetylmuramate: L-alanyl-gamma-D-glutamyl-meso-diaminopimelate ligase
LIRTVPRAGLIVANGGDPVVERVLTQGIWSPVDRFGVEGGWTAGKPDGEGGFEVALAGRALGRVRWSQTGEHNRMNALAAIAAARHAGVDPAQAIEALAGFSGVRRRMQLRGRARGVAVYDDFAHHPTAIRTTIDGLRQASKGRILAVFEPRSNTMKRGVLREALPQAFAQADLCFVYTAGLGWDPAQTFAPLGPRARCHGELDALVAAIAAECRSGDQVLVMSNGGFGGIHEKLLARLAQEAAAA